MSLHLNFLRNDASFPGTERMSLTVNAGAFATLLYHLGGGGWQEEAQEDWTPVSSMFCGTGHAFCTVGLGHLTRDVTLSHQALHGRKNSQGSPWQVERVLLPASSTWDGAGILFMLSSFTHSTEFY
jgi:hypothetical protein